MSRLKKIAKLPDDFKIDAQFYKDENGQWRFTIKETFSGESLENAFDNPTTSMSQMTRLLNERVKIWNTWQEGNQRDE
jgi:hypothetical protein